MSVLRIAVAVLLVVVGVGIGLRADQGGQQRHAITRAAVPAGAIHHIMVIDLENEDSATTFGATSPAVYLNSVLLTRGQLVTNYYATRHVSLGNYLAQISGQGPTASINNDCLNLNSLSHPPVVGGFTNVVPGVDAVDDQVFPGQVVGDGCVFPAPASGSHGATTIGDQLDARPRRDDDRDGRVSWRSYAEDMGNNPARDYGTADPMGGTDCAHPVIGGVDNSNSASATDQYATRHNPFVYFHSVIDDVVRCDSHVVPLGTVTVDHDGGPDQFNGHLYEDLRHIASTPAFMFVTPNLCNDGHDATCAGPNVEGTKDASGRNIGGLVAADLWLKHWMPMIFASPAYQSGRLLVVPTFDESGLRDARACGAADQADCHAPTGPNLTNFGFSPVLALFGFQTTPSGANVYPGGGQVGAVLFNERRIEGGSVNTTGYYNHYSALRSYEDLLGLTTGGDDGFLCDEYQAFAPSGENEPSGDEKFFSLARQAKCIPIVATQSISSLRSTLPGESWRTLLQGLRTKIFLALSDDFSTRMAADLCGKAERLKPSYSLTEAGQDARVSMLNGRPASQRSTVSASKTYSLLVDYVFQPKTFAELQNAQAIVLPYDGVDPQSPTYCYLKPYDLDAQVSYFDHARSGAL